MSARAKMIIATVALSAGTVTGIGVIGSSASATDPAPPKPPRPAWINQDGSMNREMGRHVPIYGQHNPDGSQKTMDIFEQPTGGPGGK